MKLKLFDEIKDYFNSLYWTYHPINKFYRLLRYDIPQFFKNIWHFRKPLYDYRWYDYHFSLQLFQYGLMGMVNKLEKEGYEVEDSRLKKVEKIRRAIQLIDYINEGDYLGLAEQELGMEYKFKAKFIPTEDNPDYYTLENEIEGVEDDNKKISERSYQLEKEIWEELWEIIKGNQDYTQFDKEKEFYEQFNGTDMRGWWD